VEAIDIDISGKSPCRARPILTLALYGEAMTAGNRRERWCESEVNAWPEKSGSDRRIRRQKAEDWLRRASRLHARAG
jgi:hypothetical protein